MAPPGHILTNLIINWLLDGNADRKWGKSPSIWQWTIDDCQNWLFANRLRRRRVYQHGFPGLSTSKNQGTDNKMSSATPTKKYTGVMWKWGPPKMGIPGPYIPGNIGTWVPIFLGVWGSGIPIFPGKWGSPWENGDPCMADHFLGI